MIIIYYSNLFSNFKHCFIWLRGCLKMKFTMNESKNLKSQWMKLCKRSRSKSRQIWVIDRDRDQESWINRDRDRDRDHKSAFDRDRDRDSSKLPIPVPGFPVDYWAKIYQIGAYSKILSYSILLMTQPIFIQFWWNFICAQETSSYK